MKKTILLVLFTTMLFTSCTTLDKFFTTDYSVHYDLTENQVKAAAEVVEADKLYLKKFSAKDSMGKLHQIIIYDDFYLKLDDQIFAYRYDKLMYYQLSLNLLGSYVNIDGTEQVIGFSCWATSVSNPELTVHFIFAQELFAQKHYNSQYEAGKIPGVYFSGVSNNGGYIDSWGKWHRYRWTDYFEKIFGTINQDVKRVMYMSTEVKY